jgi:predicted Zn-dependent protease
MRARIVLLTISVSLAACGPIARMIASFEELQAVQQRVAAIADSPDVSVNIVNGRVMQIGVPDVALDDDRMWQIASAAYRAYSSRSQLDSVVVSLVNRRSYFGFFTVVHAQGARQYRPQDLEERPLLVEHWVRPEPRTHLYIVAMGDADPEILAWIAEHIRERFGIAAEPLPPIPFDRATYDRGRGQVVAEGLVSAIRSRYPAVWRDVTARVIGITANDMFLRSQNWVFGFTWRSEDDRMAAVSYSRMDPKTFGLAPDEDLLKSRLAKMVGKDVGVLCFRLPLSKNPRSVMYGRIGGIDELDAMTELVDPR